MITKFLIHVGLIILCAVSLRAQGVAAVADTVVVSLAQAESQFLARNLQLVAARFNIDAARAAEVQARLWTNPSISVEQNVYNQETKKYFDVTSTGNTDIQLQQLFLLAGKRDKQITLARIGTTQSENSFEDLLRSLRLELRTDFFDLYFLQRSIRFYDESIASVNKTVAAAEVMYEKRSVLLSEVLRLKSLLFSLETERLGLVNRADALQSDLRVLLKDDARFVYHPAVSLQNLDLITITTVPLDTALRAAQDHRPDLRNAEASVAYEQTNLDLQRALAVPDVTVGGHWSRAGGYIPNYYALTVSIDLPLFNRNQGNIEVSQHTLEANKAMRNHLALGIDREVTVAYRKASETDSLYRSFDKKFAEQYRQLVEGTIANYRNRNISIMEFTDFYESYRTSMTQMYQLANDRIDAFENLNFVTNTDLIRYQ